MGRKRSFLGFFASLFMLAFSVSAFATDGYVCTRTYDSCNSGYYLHDDNCDDCPSNCTCAGGTAQPVCCGTQNCPDGYTDGGATYNSCSQTPQNACYQNCSQTCTGEDTNQCPAHATCTYNTSYSTSGSQYYGGSCNASNPGLCPFNGISSCEAGYYKNGNACDTIVVQEPAANLTYNGSAQTCPSVTVTTPASGNTIRYGTASGTYGNNTPSQLTNVGSTVVYYQVTTSDGSTTTGSYTCTMNPAPITASASDKTLTYDSTAQSCANVTVTSPSGTTITYSTAQNGTYAADVTLTDVGTATIWYKVEKANYTTATGSYTCTMNRATMDANLVGNTKEYDGTPLTCNGGTPSGVPAGSTITYSTTNGSGYSSNAPTRTDVGTTTVYYKVTNSNYNDFTGSFTCNVTPVDCDITLSETSGNTTYPTAKTFTATTSNGCTLTVSPTSGSTNVAIASISNGTVTATPQKTGTQIITVTASDNNANHNNAVATYTLTVNSGTINATASNNSKVYDGTALTCDGNIVITAPSDGTTTQYATQTNGTCGSYGNTAPTATTVADSKTICYKITKTGYTDFTGTYECTIEPATIPNNDVSITGNSLTYDGTSTTNGSNQSCGTVTSTLGATVTYAVQSGGTCGSYGPSAPTMKNVSESPKTICYKLSKENYADKTGTYQCTMDTKGMTVTEPTNTLTYTGNAQTCPGVSVTLPTDSANVTIKYGTSSGTYNANSPRTITNVSNTTVYYQVTATNFTTTTGSYTCTMNKADGTTTIKDGNTTVNGENVTTQYPNTKTLTATCAGNGTPTVTSGTTAVATASISNGTITLTPVKQGTSVITVNCPATSNYTASSATVTLTVDRGDCTITLNPDNGVITYPTTTTTFNISKGVCNGTISATSNDTAIATVSLNSNKTVGTVTYQSKGSTTITVTSAQTDQYNAASATYSVTTSNGGITCQNTSQGCGNKSFTYDGNQHSCAISSNAVTPSDVEIKYSTTSGSSYSSSVPTVTNVSDTKTIYYQLTRTGYETEEGQFECAVTNATINVSASTVKLSYNGNQQSCGGGVTATPSDATVTYSTSANGTYASGAPTLTNGGQKTIYYKVSRQNYATASGSYLCTMAQVTLNPNNGTLTYPTASGTFTATTYSGGTFSVASSDTAVATADIASGVVTITPHQSGTANITVTSAANGDYASASATYALTVADKTITIKKNGGSGTCGGVNGTADGTITCTYATNTCTAPSWNAATCNIANGISLLTGWTADDASGSAVAFGDDVKNVTSLYATWAQCQCTATGNANNCTIDGVTNNACNYTYTCTTGYGSGGSGSGTQANPAVTVSCGGGNTITLDWDENGGTTVQNGSCTYGGDLVLPASAASTRNGYTFVGWKAYDNNIYSAGATISGGCTQTYTGVTGGNSGAIQAQWCQNCAAENATCELTTAMTTGNGMCTYTTACNAGYGNIQNDGKYNVSCSACGNGEYSDNGSCTQCPPADNGWTVFTTSPAAGLESCFERQTPEHCDGGTVKRQADSANSYSSTISVETPLTVNAGYHVNGTTCEANTYTVTYSCGTDSTGGTPPGNDTATYGEQFTPAQNTTCEKTNYLFEKWNDGTVDRPAGTSFTWTYTEAKTFTAKYRETSNNCQGSDDPSVRGQYFDNETTHTCQPCPVDFPLSADGAVGENSCYNTCSTPDCWDAGEPAHVINKDILVMIFGGNIQNYIPCMGAIQSKMYNDGQNYCIEVDRGTLCDYSDVWCQSNYYQDKTLKQCEDPNDETTCVYPVSEKDNICQDCGLLHTDVKPYDYPISADGGIHGTASCYGQMALSCWDLLRPEENVARCYYTNGSASIESVTGRAYYPGTEITPLYPCYIDFNSGCDCDAGYEYVFPTYEFDSTDPGKCVAGVYQITLNDNGGSGGDGAVFEKFDTGWYSSSEDAADENADPVSSVTIPTRENYTFLGYYTAEDTENPVIDGDGSIIAGANTFTGAATLYAQWRLNKFQCTAGYTGVLVDPSVPNVYNPCPTDSYCPGNEVDADKITDTSEGCAIKCPADLAGNGTVSSPGGENAKSITACQTTRNNVPLINNDDITTGTGDQVCNFKYTDADHPDQGGQYDANCNTTVKTCIGGYWHNEANYVCTPVGVGAWSPEDYTGRYQCSDLQGADSTVTTADAYSSVPTQCYNVCSDIPIDHGLREKDKDPESYDDETEEIPECTYTTKCANGYKPDGITCVPKVYTVNLNHNNEDCSGDGCTVPNSPIYLKFDTGWYYSEADANADENAIDHIDVPQWPGETFGGYMFGDDIVINNSGVPTSNTPFSGDEDVPVTISAKWTTNPPIHCERGTYYTGHGNQCSPCLAGSYCPPVDTLQDIGRDMGIIACPSDTELYPDLYTAAMDASGNALNVTITSEPSSGYITDCYATNVAYEPNPNYGTGKQTCSFNETKKKYVGNGDSKPCTDITMLTCIVGYWLDTNETTANCTKVASGWYSPAVSTEHKECPNHDTDSTITSSDAAGSVEQCHLDGRWVVPTNGHSAFRRSCYHVPDETNTDKETGYTYNCDKSTIVACDAGFYDGGEYINNDITDDDKHDCKPVDAGHYSPAQSACTGEDLEPTTPGCSTKQTECPSGWVGTDTPAATFESCYKSCAITVDDVEYANTVSPEDPYVHAISENEYDTCSYNVECQTGYDPGEDSTNPSCVAHIYTVTLNKNGGEGSTPQTHQCTFGESCTLPGITDARRGYHTTGEHGEWCSDANGSAPCYSAETPIAPNISADASDITLYAKWEPSIYKITLDAGVTDLETYGAPSEVYLKYNTGWYQDANATQGITKLDTKPTKWAMTFGGYNSANNTQIIDGNGDFITDNPAALTFTDSDATITSQWGAGSISCPTGTFYSGHGINSADSNVCKTCEAGYYCPGVDGTTTDSDNEVGKEPCPAPFTHSASGISDPGDCYMECSSVEHGTVPPSIYRKDNLTQCPIISCDAGYYVSGNTCTDCPEGSYCDGNDNPGITPCTSLGELWTHSEPKSTNASGCYRDCKLDDVNDTNVAEVEGRYYHPNVNNCQIKTCQPGYWLDNGVCRPCSANNYCPDGINQEQCMAPYDKAEPGKDSARYCYKECDNRPHATEMQGKDYDDRVDIPEDDTCQIKTCAAGYWLDTEADECKPCTTGNYCPEGENERPCPEGYTSDALTVDKAHCYKQCTVENATASGKDYYGEDVADECEIRSCASGYMLNATGTACVPCAEGYYCDGGNGDNGNGSTNCPDGYTSDGGTTATSIYACYQDCQPHTVDGNCDLVPRGGEPYHALYGEKCEYTATINGNEAEYDPDTNTCTLVGCMVGQEMVNGTCQACAREHALIYKDGGTCLVKTCEYGWHPAGDACESDTIECTPKAPNSEYAEQVWIEADGAFDTCIIKICKDGYHLESNACAPDVQPCEIKHGTGKKTWNSLSGSWNECVAESCMPGYTNNPSETRNIGEQCGECSNKYGDQDSIAVSSYIQGCEIASCMYQGEKYKLEDGRCISICDKVEDDGTGSRYWDDDAKKCIRTCNDGYKPW